MSRLRALVATMAVLAYAGVAGAHDLWLVPEPAASGGPVVIRMGEGTDFPASLAAPELGAFERLLLVRPDGSHDSLRTGGTTDNAVRLEFDAGAPGVYVAAATTRPAVVGFSGEKFNEYLVEDGLYHIYRLRAAEGTLSQPARERYSKSPKALIRIGDGPGDPSRVLGLPLEIVPLADPFTVRVGETLRVRVLFRGTPLVNAMLGWDLPGDGDGFTGSVRTDGRGEALVPIARTGLFTLRLVHMTRPRAESYEWESFWTTLTFRVGN